MLVCTGHVGGGSDGLGGAKEGLGAVGHSIGAELEKRGQACLWYGLHSALLQGWGSAAKGEEECCQGRLSQQGELHDLELD